MKALDVLARLRLPDGRFWIDAAVEFQVADVNAVLGGERPYNFITRSRVFGVLSSCHTTKN
jgi:hypothetical protein